MREDLDVGMKCIKYMLFITNFMFVMIGFLLISIGSTINAIYSDFDVFLRNHYFSPSALIIAIGIIIFFVALFGCVGAIKESTCLVNLFALALGLVLILEVSAAIAAFAMNNDIKFAIASKMNLAVDLYEKNNCARDGMDFLQQRLQCCGVDSYTDWDTKLNGVTGPSISNNTPNGTYVPESCCYQRRNHHYDDDDDHSSESREHDGATTQDPDTAECKLFANGCLDRLTYVVRECAIMLGTGALCVAFVQLLGVIFANMLAKGIRRVKSDEARKRWESRQSLYEQLAQQHVPPMKQTVYGNSGTTDA